jgi:hypothetical protein
MTSHAESGRQQPAYLVGDEVLLLRGTRWIDARVNAIYRRDARWLFVVATVDGPSGVGESVTVRSSTPDGRTRRLVRARQRGVPG